MTPVELIAVLEVATGPSLDLSHRVAEAVGWVHRENVKNDFKWLGPDGQAYLVPPHFTKSLDAAMTTVMEGYEWQLEFGEGEYKASVWAVPERAGDGLVCIGATPAIALCIVALCARLI